MLVLEVVAFEDSRDNLRAPESRRDAEVRRVPPGTGRTLLSGLMLRLLRTLKRQRPPTIAALAESLGRDVRGHLALLERLGVVRLRDSGRRGGPITPELLYDAIQLKVGF